MVCCNPLQMTAAETALLPHDNIEVIELSQDDAWFRDTGPTVSTLFCDFCFYLSKLKLPFIATSSMYKNQSSGGVFFMCV